jgi:hypothetical protein
MGGSSGSEDKADTKFVAELEQSLADARAGRVFDAHDVAREAQAMIEAHKEVIRQRERAAPSQHVS